jgi:hypothetical protein
MRAAANDAGARREVKARGRFRCRMTAARKFFGRQIACRPFRTSDAGDRYQTKKYASAMIAAIATPNQIMGWVILSCDWDWVVMDLPFPPGRGPQGWDLPVLGDPYNALDFRLIPRLSFDSDQNPVRVPQVPE